MEYTVEFLNKVNENVVVEATSFECLDEGHVVFYERAFVNVNNNDVDFMNAVASFYGVKNITSTNVKK